MKIRTQKTEYLHLSEKEFKKYFLDEDGYYSDDCILYFSKGYSYEADEGVSLEDNKLIGSSYLNGILYYEDGEYTKMVRFSETKLGKLKYIEIEVTPNLKKFIKDIMK